MDDEPRHSSDTHAIRSSGRGAWRVRTISVLLASDTAMLLAGALSAAWIRFGFVNARVSFENSAMRLDYATLSVIATVMWLVFLALERLYDLERLFWGAGEFTRVVRALTVGVVAFILLTYALQTPSISRVWTMTAWALCIAFVTAGRLVVRAVLDILRKRGVLAQRTLIVGSNAEAADIIRVLVAHPVSGLVPFGCMASSQAERLDLDYCTATLPMLGHARDLRAVVREHDIEAVVIASSAFDHDVLGRMIAELRGLPVTIHVSSGLFEVLTSRVFVREVGGVPLIAVRGVSLAKRKLLTKRAFDLLVATLMLLIGLPLWIIVVAAIKFTSRGPILYAQERVGRGGRPFGMLKFRSMVADADAMRDELVAENEASGPLFKMRDDPRVTAVGKVIRRYSIDEFPQLINVMKGEMSLVGPRPPLPEETQRYSEHHWRRMEVLPGMTGLWQVSGRSDLTFEDMVRLDLFYIENWSVTLDVGIMFRTIPAVLAARGAY